jgi:hypothetical protein
VIIAVLALDPAAVGPCGLAGRILTQLPTARVTEPAFKYEGSVFNNRMYDDLCVWLCDEKVEQVVLGCESTAYRSLTIARHLGRAQGAIEAILIACNFIEPHSCVQVPASRWRKHCFGRNAPAKRVEQKQAAIDYVRTKYTLEAGPDLSEAIGLLDYLCQVPASERGGK